MLLPFVTALTLSMVCQAPSADRSLAERLARSGQTVEALGLFEQVVVAIVESVGYRQVNSLWGCLGTVQALTGKSGWGSMKRRAF